MTRAIQGLLFDKDGTLFDFEATWAVWTQGLLADEAGGDAARLARLAEAVGFDLGRCGFHPDSPVIADTADEVAVRLLPHVEDTELGALVTRMNARAAAAPQAEAVPLAPLLDGLLAAGYQLGVATNDAAVSARAHLEQAGVRDRFRFVAGYDSGHGAKPEPGPCLAFAAACGLAPGSCAMIGDSLHDLHAGRAAGMRTVAVLTGLADAATLAPHADVVLPSIGDLPGWLATL
jgi:phosphoglycolate phosphatase